MKKGSTLNRKCSIEGCDRKHEAKGLCKMHWTRMNRNGTIELIREHCLIKRFEKNYIPEPMSGCWLWTAYGNEKEYGRIYVNGKLESAHRISWRMHRGPIPRGLHVLHKCDTPSCVNPDHLWLGTNTDNVRDALKKGRLNLEGLKLGPLVRKE